METTDSCKSTLGLTAATKPSLQRLAQMGGVKTIASDCVDPLRELLAKRCMLVCETMLTVNNLSKTRTLMLSDLYAALERMGVKLAKSNAVGNSTISLK